MRIGPLAPVLSLLIIAGSSPLRAAEVYALVQRPSGVVKAPLFAPEQASLPIARVGERTVTLSELAEAIGTWHQANVKSEKQAGKKDFKEILDRLIGVRLIVQEAQAMGMDDIDSIKADLAQYPQTAMREQLQRRAVKGVKADPSEVKRLYRDAVREWKLESALFNTEEDAKALVAAAKAGQPFSALVRKAVAEKKARSGTGAAYFDRSKMLPQVVVVAERLKPGEVSAPIQVAKTGFAVVHLIGERYPENANARAAAQQQGLAKAKAEKLRAYYDALVKRYVKVDEALFAAIDFEAKEPGFAALEKDQRALAKVEGGKPITVADLAGEARQAFFHSVEQAIESKKVNAKKADFLDALMSRQVVALEGARLKLAETPEYKKALSDHRDQLLFAAFVTRVIIPDLKIGEAELTKYYEDHKTEFSYPAFYRLQSLAFTSHKAAQAAFDKLRAGTDFKWLQTNADDQVPVDERAFELDGSVVSANSLLPAVAKAVAGARSGDVRVAEYKGQHFVIVVAQVTPPAPQPFADTREIIAPKVQIEALNKAMGDWIQKLRKAHDVKVYITAIVS
jgi:hypothetical protein